MTRSPGNKIAVLGAGSWGTALAMVLAGNGQPTTLWSHRKEHARTLQSGRCNQRYLPGISFPQKLQIEDDLQVATTNAKLILIVVPSHAFRATLQRIKRFLTPKQNIACATKGLEPGTQKLLHQMVQEELGEAHKLAVLSGPTFAQEVAHQLPGAVTIASNDSDFAMDLAQIFNNNYFRTYTSSDMIGVQIGGAVKNVLAIAAGTADGLGFGANARAALIARGVAEITRLGTALGARPETFMGLTGLGDLVLTCTDDQSRNRRLGLALGKGKSIAETVKVIGQVVEGISTSKEVRALAQSLKINMPISEQVYRVIHENLPPEDAVQALMERAIRSETD